MVGLHHAGALQKIFERFEPRKSTFWRSLPILLGVFVRSPMAAAPPIALLLAVSRRS
jgi:hypothetical protein